jgi:hypothetical protein
MEVKLEPKAHYFQATFTGQASTSELLRCFYATVDAASRQGFSLMMLDLFAVEGSLSTQDRLELGENAAAYSLNKRWVARPRMAVVGRPLITDGFVSEVASTRGMNVRTFAQFQEALGWLRKFMPGRIRSS